tara:strand:+ start:2010 stop:3362 length:1353 start_codon:yes stop_codon:yes gene_type:complete
MPESTTLVEIPSQYILESGIPSLVSSGSGVHLEKDVTFSFNFMNREGAELSTVGQINNSFFIGDQQIDIIDKNGTVVAEKFYTGAALKSFTFKEQDNLDVFSGATGKYVKDFGIKVKVNDPTIADGVEGHQSVYKCFGNVPQIQSIKVIDGSGTFQYAGNTTPSGSLSSSKDFYSGDNLSTAGIDERTGNRDFLSAKNVTGVIKFDLTFQNDPTYTRFEKIEIYATTGISGVGNPSTVGGKQPVTLPAPIPANFVRSIPVLHQSKRQQIEISKDSIGDIFNEGYSRYYNFSILPYSKLGSGVRFGVGPHAFVDSIKTLNEVETDKIRLTPNSTTSSTPDEANISYLTGRITSTAAVKVDTLPHGQHHNVHYMLKVQTNDSNVHTTNLMASLKKAGTISSASDYEVQEYGQTSSYGSAVEACLEHDSDNVYLEITVPSNLPADYSIYRTSI